MKEHNCIYKNGMCNCILQICSLHIFLHILFFSFHINKKITINPSTIISTNSAQLMTTKYYTYLVSQFLTSVLDSNIFRRFCPYWYS